MSVADGPFSYRTGAGGDVAIRRGGRVVATLRGDAAGAFLARIASATPDELQRAMARATGNYRRGNERQAATHPRHR